MDYKWAHKVNMTQRYIKWTAKTAPVTTIFTNRQRTSYSHLEDSTLLLKNGHWNWYCWSGEQEFEEAISWMKFP